MTGSLRSHATLVLALGFLGGLLLVGWGAAFGTGKTLLVPFGLLIAILTIVLRGEHVPMFRQRFMVAFGAFMVSSLVLYGTLVFSPQTASLSIAEHGWRLAVLVLIAAVVTLPVARLSAISRVQAGSS